nr:hypothetical protein [Tanacetum cinerariifolium]
MGIRRVVPRNYNPKGERFLIASRFPTPPLACAFFSLRVSETSSSKLARDQTSNPTSSANPTPKGRIRRSSKQKVENSHFEEHLTPVATMTDNRTMAEMLRAPTEGNSSKNMPRFSSNDMVYNQYLEEAKNKTQDEVRNSKPSVMPSARSQSTTNDSKPKPRINNQKSRNWPASKSSFVMTKTVPIAKHSRNFRNFSDTKHFVCSTYHKCVFNANHDSCVTKFLNKVNSRAKFPSNKTININKPVEQVSVAKKPKRQIPKGHRFSIKKTSVVHEKTITPRSCLSWKPTGKYFKIICLGWVPTEKIFTSSTTKVDSEPTNGSVEDITNKYEYEQTFDVSACTLNLCPGTSFNPKKEGLGVLVAEKTDISETRASRNSNMINKQ